MDWYLNTEEEVDMGPDGEPELQDVWHEFYTPSIPGVHLIYSERGSVWFIRESEAEFLEPEKDKKITADDIPYKDRLLQAIFESKWSGH